MSSNSRGRAGLVYGHSVRGSGAQRGSLVFLVYEKDSRHPTPSSTFASKGHIDNINDNKSFFKIMHLQSL